MRTALRGKSTILTLPIGCSGPISAVATACFLVGVGALAAWQTTGNPAWIREYFQVPGALLMLWLAGVELWLSLAARSHFGSGELMRQTWTWVSLSAAAQLVGAACVQIFSVESRLNLLASLPGWSSDRAQAISIVGHLAGGPVRFTFLAVGLGLALRTYRKARFLGRLRRVDWAILAAFATYLFWIFGEVVSAFRAGKQVSWVEVANWPTDPLLMLLLAIGLRLYRSVQEMGDGWIGRCWKGCCIGVFLTAIGDVGAMFEAYQYIWYPWTTIVWFVWIPAAASLALAPAHQLEAIRYAREGRSTIPG